MPSTVPCIFCGTPTPFRATHKCVNCYEVTKRLEDFLKSSTGQQHVLAQLLSKDLALAILRMDDIGYEEGLGPYTVKQAVAWESLLATAELIAGKRATSTRIAALETK